MDWLTRMNRALDYIEGHLAGELDIAQAAKLACCSSFQFQRIFSLVADVPLGEYIRRRRLSLAAMELLTTDARVIDVAAAYGYDSPVSFARAFAAVHGVNPSQIRRPGVTIRAYPRMTFEITIKGVQAMNYRIETFGQLRLIGYRERFSSENGENLRSIPAFWDEKDQDGGVQRLMQYNTYPELKCLGVCANEEGDEFDYFIATGSDLPTPPDMAELIVPGSTYAIFECCGPLPEAMQSTWKRVFSEWFPTASYDLAPGPQLEWYDGGDMSAADYRTEIWIPVTKK